ncbi:MAG TPA: glycosyltransferase family 4 protein [Bacteroidota bacterium]
MRILIFNWQDIKNPNSGGAEVHLHETFSRIATMGHEVTLYCSSFRGGSARERLNGIEVIREGGRYLFNYHVMWKYLTRFRHERYDVIVDDLNKIPFFTPWYVREPLVGILHHLFGTSIFLEVPFPLAAYVYGMEFVAASVYRSVPFIVVSPSTREELVSRGFRPEMVSLIHYGVQDNLYRVTGVPKSEAPLVGHVGRLKRYKCVDHLVRAFAIVKLAVTSAELLIVGDGEDRPRLEKVVRDLGLGGSVRFAGHVNDDEKVRYLQQMHVVVNSSSKEGWGMTVVEAYACGTCAIASRVPGLRDAVREGETGILYEFGNVRELAAKIISLLNDSGLRQRLSQNALEWSRTFRWDTAATQTLEVLQSAVSERKL